MGQSSRCHRHLSKDVQREINGFSLHIFTISYKIGIFELSFLIFQSFLILKRRKLLLRSNQREWIHVSLLYKCCIHFSLSFKKRCPFMDFRSKIKIRVMMFAFMLLRSPDFYGLIRRRQSARYQKQCIKPYGDFQRGDLIIWH